VSTLIGVLVVATPLGATTAIKPTVSGFTSSEMTLYKTGGTVTLSATVTNAITCVFSSPSGIPSLPATVDCSSGSASHVVTLPPNAGKRSVKYKFGLTATGSRTVQAKKITVTVSTASAPPTADHVVSTTGEFLSNCAVLSSGGVHCWGMGLSGDLGNGITYGPPGYGSPAPVTVDGVGGAGVLTGVLNLAADGSGYCALLATGGVDCWGNGSNVPATIQSTNGVGSLSGVVSLASNASGYCGVLTSGNVGCWSGGSVIPALLSGTGGMGELSNVASISSDSGGFCALLTSTSVDCWDNGAAPVSVSGVGGSGFVRRGLDGWQQC